METKATIVFNKIRISNINIRDIAETFESRKYSNETGIGFTYVHIEDDSIFTKVLVRTPSYVQTYNSQEKIFEKNIIYIYDETELVLDLHSELIYSTSSSSKFNKAKSLLRNCLKSKVTFENLEYSSSKLLDRISSLGWNYRIIDLAIKRFRYKEGAVGRLSIHLDNSEIGKELFDLYSESITRITVNVESKTFNDFFFSVTSQNSFTIRSEESEFWSIVNLIKRTL